MLTPVGHVDHMLLSLIKIGSLQAKFDSVLTKIRSATKDFEDEATLAYTLSTTTALRELHDMLPEMRITPRQSDGVFSVPWSRNPRFFEAKDEISQLYAFVCPSTEEQRSCAILGMPGVGKTQTALEVAFRYKEQFQFVFWVPAQSETGLAEAFSGIARSVGTPSAAEKSADLLLLVEEARSWLCQSTYDTITPNFIKNTNTLRICILVAYL